ncbi:MAG: hypothetical protein IJF17_05410, partial [Thermoguttaceae bacterium]|nr:hypothetical protein [Thermoguttaceae bacterium]
MKKIFGVILKIFGDVSLHLWLGRFKNFFRRFPTFRQTILQRVDEFGAGWVAVSGIDGESAGERVVYLFGEVRKDWAEAEFL